MPRLTEQEQQEILRFIESGKPLPDKYRFLLFEDNLQDFLTPIIMKEYLYKLILVAKYVNVRDKVMACRLLKMSGK